MSQDPGQAKTPKKTGAKKTQHNPLFQEALTHYEEFFNQSPTLHAIINEEGFLEKINPAWEKVLGWTHDELRSHPLVDYVFSDDVVDVRELLKKPEADFSEVRLICKDGSCRWFLCSTKPDSRTKKNYCSAIDITTRKQEEASMLDSKTSLEALATQLQEQNRRLDEFAHIISHNLRAPLNNIQALVKLTDDRSTVDDYKLVFGKLEKISKNLKDTMNELMDALKARDNSQIDLVEIRFKDILDKVVQSLEGDLIMTQASLTFDFNDAPAVRYQKTAMESIFQNLLSNAIKYRSPQRKPMIHFESKPKGEFVELTVEDNGQGIDMEKFHDKIFGLHNTFHDHREARGVGLFLVKNQIESLGGSISVKSEVDKGSVFTVRFANKQSAS